MIIKKETKKKKNSYILNKFLLLYFFLTVIFFTISISMVLKSNTFKKTKVQFLDKISRYGRYNYLYLPQIFFGALKSNFTHFEKLNLEISFENILIIENLRSESIANRDLPPRHLIPKINLDIIHNGKRYSGDARLKGDRIIHYEKKKNTSYKIELDKNNYLFGIKKFSIQKPVIRNYAYEWIFHELAKEFGIIKLTYKFINLSVNGEDRGLFVLEEGFGKELIEKNNRRNGPIFGLNEDLNYSSINPVFEIYNKKFWEKNENEIVALIASQKLRDFFDKKLEAKDVFDLDKWASYFAIIDLTGTWHGALLKSVKFYYNPINGLFEPIPFDGQRFKPNYNKFNLSYDNKLVIDFLKKQKIEGEQEGLGWLEGFFFINGKLNQNFYDLYVQKLSEISSPEFIENFLSKNLKKINKINSHIYSDSIWFHHKASGMGLYYFSLNDFYYQAKNIVDKLNKKGGIQILQTSDKSEFLIKDYYKNYASFKIDKFICNNSEGEIEIILNETLNNFENTIINIPELKNKNIKCKYVQLSNKNNKNSALKKIDYINSYYKYNNFKNDESLKYGKYFYEDNQKLFLVRDETIINHNLYIPKGFEIVIKEKQKIFLVNNAFIISDSPWIIGGENFETLISGKKDNLGGGILIKDNKKITIIKNTKFSHLTGFYPNTPSEFIIMGSINFHETNVKINNSKFENIYSEDAVNIFRSKFEINKNNYKNINSDAIDVDFSKGEIRSSHFENVKNDAIDFSGSNAIVKDSVFKNVNDKVISVGEKSKIKVFKINAKNSHVGIVSKDGSFVITNDVEFDGVKIPFAAYQKKKEYDHGTLIVKNYNIKNFHTKWLKDKGSTVTANKKSLNINTKEILSIINDKKFHLISVKND
tara:strand:- start:1009 stop:3633 length:2625 start_codon:yes stop_codon:yes gene_type:complete